jgi:hypothetical protein
MPVAEDQNEVARNRAIWDLCKTVPSEMCSPIEGGRLSGKTNIKPQWRIQKMTEIFGPVGTGWWYEIIEQKEMAVTDGQVLLFMKIDLYYLLSDAKVSRPIPGVGCAFIIEKEKLGLHVSEYASKSALTDALGIAMKALGVGADVYDGTFEREQDVIQAQYDQYKIMLFQFLSQLGSQAYDAIMSTYQPVDDKLRGNAELQSEVYEKLQAAMPASGTG